MATRAEHESRQPARPKREAGKPVRRQHYRGITILVLLLALVWFLPIILIHTPLLQWGIRKATAEINGTVAVESVSAGWLSPITARGIEVHDVQGNSVLSTPLVVSDKSLVSILCNYKSLGLFRVQKPKLSVVVREDGSNVEDLIAQHTASKKPHSTSNASASSSLESIGLALQIEEGTVVLTDSVTGNTKEINKLNVMLDMSSGIGTVSGAMLAAEFPAQDQTGLFAVSWKKTGGVNEVTMAAKQVPLTTFGAVLSRMVPKTSLSGQLNCSALALWGDAKDGKTGIQADLNIEGLTLATPSLQSDVIRLERFHSGCQASWQTNLFVIENSSIDCDVGSVAATCTIPLNTAGGMSFEAIVKQPQDIRAQVDLARLARLLPATLHLRQNVQIQSGQFQAVLTSQPDAQGAAWHGQMNITPLTAVRQGQPISWGNPISMAFNARQIGQQPVQGDLNCESAFLKIQGAGSLNNLDVSTSFSLKQLADPLQEFVDFGGAILTGEGTGRLRWQHSEQGPFASNANIQIRQLELALPDHQSWREDQLQMTAEAKGQTDFSDKTQLDSAVLQVLAGGDSLDVQLGLIPAVANAKNQWSIAAQLKGNLQSWPARLGIWLSMKDWQMAGTYLLSLQGSGSTDGVEVRQAGLSIAPLIVSSPTVNINEPKLDVAIAGTWNSLQRRLQVPFASLACDSASVRADNLIVGFPENGTPEMAGTLKYQGYLERLRPWFTDHTKPSTWQLAGQVNGAVQFTQSGQQICGENMTNVVNLTIVDSAGGQFQEPNIQCVLRGGYDHQTATMQLEQCELTSTIVAASAKGRIASINGQQAAQADAQFNYDLDRLTKLLAPYFGSEVRMMGRGTSQAYYRGPLALNACEAGTGMRWDSAEVYGLHLGPGEIKAGLANGLLQVTPFTLAIGQGQIRLAPQLRVSPSPMELNMAPGPLLERIAIDPTLCNGWMKYIAPALADVAKVQGSISLSLKKCCIPLNDPAKSDLAGELFVHSVDVTPGPLLNSMSSLFSKQASASLRRDSVVPFRMVDGRVYHESLEIILPEITIRTSGWVGLDQSMAVTAEMPVPPKWLQNNPLAANLRNQTIRVPIAGTLKKPEVDHRIVEQLTKQFMRKAAEGAIENEANKQLDRLFGTKK